MSFFEDLLAGGPVVADGAWGTQLQARGLALGECPDAWNLSHPERVAEVARAYVDAGSRVILTNTFRSNRLALEPAGLGGALREINRAGVEISRQAAAGRALVFASMGPSGRMLAAGDVTAAQLSAAFAEQAAALAEAGADALLVETMSDLEEACLAVSAARATGLPVVASMVFDAGKNRDRTMMGTTPEQAAAGLAEAGAGMVGANCGHGLAGFAELTRRLRAAGGLPVWIKPNAGLPELQDGVPLYRMTADEFASHTPALAKAGAAILGGCCGTGPEFIRALARQVIPCA